MTKVNEIDGSTQGEAHFPRRSLTPSRPRLREKSAPGKRESTERTREMMIEYTEDQFGLICNLLHQAICEQRPEPNLETEELGFTGPAERAFATAILEDALGMRWALKCPDCQGYDPESYVVHAAVWAAAGLELDSGWFHLACLSKRLGRELTEADFPADASANDWQPWGES